MKVKLEHMPSVLAQYMDTEVVPKYTGWHKAAAIGAGIILNQKAAHIVAQHALIGTLQSLGIADENGLIDLEQAKVLATDILQKSGGEIDDMGYVFDNTDLEKIYKLAASVAEPGS